MNDAVEEAGTGTVEPAGERAGARAGGHGTEATGWPGAEAHGAEAAGGHGSRAAGVQEETDGRYAWVALSVTTTGALLAALQGSALLIALPDILVQLQTSFLTIMWVLLGYLLITTALVPVIGRLADMFGRKKLFNAGFIVFTLASLLAGLSVAAFHGVDLLIYRALQGVGGALLLTNSTAIVTDAFKRGKVGFGLGVNQIAAAAGFVLGPVIGGLLTAISWRWVFLINVPIGVIGVLWGIKSLREPVKLPGRQTFDWPGSITFVLGLGSALGALSMVAFPAWGWSTIYAMFIVGVIGLLAFVAIELRVPQPMLNLHLFQDRLFTLANLSNLLNGVARGAVLFLLIFFLQGPYGQDPLLAGIMMAPFGLAFMVIGPISGYLSDHHGSRVLGTVGLLASAVGLFGLATITDQTPFWQIALWMAVMGGGSGFFNSPNTNVIMTSVSGAERGAAAGVRTMLANTGQMLSIAIAFPLVLAKIPEDAMMQIFLYGGGMGSNTEALGIFLSGLHQAFLISAGVSVIAALASALQPAHGRPGERAPAVGLTPAPGQRCSRRVVVVCGGGGAPMIRSGSGQSEREQADERLTAARQTVIVPLDGSLCAIHALPFARAAARTFGGRLVLVRALDRPLERTTGRDQPTAHAASAEPAPSDLESELEGLVQMLGREGIAAEARVRCGPAAAAIRAAASEHQADLIVMASHQRHGLDRWLHGSVAEAVLHGTSVPVLIVPREGAHVPTDGSPLRVLVPLDESSFAEVALNQVRRTAATRRVEVLLVQIARLRVAMIGPLTTYALSLEDGLRAAETYLDGLAETLRADGIPTRVLVCDTRQTVAEEILALAEREGANTIVMATHGRGALAHLALGSVSTAVLEHSPIPVLLVPGHSAGQPHEPVAEHQTA